MATRASTLSHRIRCTTSRGRRHSSSSRKKKDSRAQRGHPMIATTLRVVLVHLLLEVANGSHHALHLRRRRQYRRAEVKGVRLLPEAGPGHHHNTGGLQQLQRPPRVQRQLAALLLVLRLVVLRVPGRQRDLREGVHRTLHKLAGHPANSVQLTRQQGSALLQAREDAVVLRPVRLVARVTLLRRRAHQRRHDLPAYVGAQVDGAHLRHLLPHRGRQVRHAEVPAAAPALADDALRRGVQRDEHRARAVRRRHRQYHLAEAHKLAVRGVDVLLVHLVRQQQHIVVVAEPHHVLHHLAVQHAAGRVAGVDAHQQARRRTVLQLALLISSGQVIRLHRPPVLLTQVVRGEGAAQQRQLRRVQRVLRDRQHHAVAGASDQKLHKHLHAAARAVRQADRVERRLGLHVVIALVDVRRHRLSGKVVPERSRVGARGRADVAQILLRARHRVRREARHKRLVLQQERRVEECHNLAVEGERLLAQRLRVADVAVHEAREGVGTLALRNLLLDLIRAGRDEAADGVLRTHHMRVHVDLGVRVFV